MPTLQDGRAAIDQGNLQQARLIFEAILQENPRDEEAWFELGNVLTETKDKRICYENVLKIDDSHQSAREALRNLEPEADPLRRQFQLEEAIEEPDLEDDDEGDTVVSERPDFEFADDAEKETPTALLVAVGLALSVVVFAVGGGLVFVLITSLTGR
jgi:tetratricopeptide (TPR) repeat protein